jgi:hypothetical protein
MVRVLVRDGLRKAALRAAARGEGS